MDKKNTAILVVMLVILLGCVAEKDTRPTYEWDPDQYVGDLTLAVPTDNPVYQKWTLQQVIDVFIAHGLEVGDYYVTTIDDYWAIPYDPPVVPIGNMRFLIPSLCDTCGGRILSFQNSEDLLATKYYYLEIGRANAFLFSWVIEKDNILVQINGFVEQDSVRKYEDALESLGK